MHHSWRRTCSRLTHSLASKYADVYRLNKIHSFQQVMLPGYKLSQTQIFTHQEFTVCVKRVNSTSSLLQMEQLGFFFGFKLASKQTRKI